MDLEDRNEENLTQKKLYKTEIKLTKLFLKLQQYETEASDLHIRKTIRAAAQETLFAIGKIRQAIFILDE